MYDSFITSNEDPKTLESLLVGLPKPVQPSPTLQNQDQEPVDDTARLQNQTQKPAETGPTSLPVTQTSPQGQNLGSNQPTKPDGSPNSVTNSVPDSENGSGSATRGGLSSLLSNVESPLEEFMKKTDSHLNTGSGTGASSLDCLGC